MLNFRKLYSCLVILALAACKKEKPPVRDVVFSLRYDSVGVTGRSNWPDVKVQFGLSSTSCKDSNATPDVLPGTFANGPYGILTATGHYRSGDRRYGYVKFLDITNPANSMLPMAGYMSAVCCIDDANLGTKALTLRYEDYQNSPQKRYVDKGGKTI